jgi:hypothetical protein
MMRRRTVMNHRRNRRGCSRDARRRLDVDGLLKRTSPVFEAFHIEEPQILFGSGIPAVDPKAGIITFGPYGSSSQSPKQIRIGVIGTGEGIQATRAYLQSCWENVKPGLNSREKPFDVLCFPNFPGLKPDCGFRAEFKIAILRDIPMERFRMSVKPVKASEKLKGVVELVDKQLEMMKAAEPVPDVVLIVLPKPVEDSCATIGAAFMRKRAPLSPKEKGLEGIIAKRKSSIYRPGKRSPDWLKIKSRPQQEFVVCGFTEGKGSRKHFGALLLGGYRNGKLQYFGHSGTGFSEKGLADAIDRLRPFFTDRPPVENPPKIPEKIQWVQPKLVCEVTFAEWTEDEQLRLTTFLGWRDDKNPGEVVL